MPSKVRRDPRDPDNPYRIGQIGWRGKNKGKLICGAENNDGSNCHVAILDPDNGRCRKHGGASLKGIESKTFKDGSYSRYMPRGMVEHWNEVMEVNGILNLTMDVRLLRTRIIGILENLKNQGNTGGVGELLKAWQNYKTAILTEDEGSILTAFNKLDDAMLAVDTEAAAWVEIYDVLDLKRRTTDSQRKAFIQAQKMISEIEFNTFLTALALSLNTRLAHDPESKALIAGDIRSMVYQRRLPDLVLSDGSAA